jgi:hypothetical protein
MFKALIYSSLGGTYIKQLIHFVRIVSELEWTLLAASQYAQNVPVVVYTVPPDDEQIVLEKCRDT